jgi:hypothetical protein
MMLSLVFLVGLANLGIAIWIGSKIIKIEKLNNTELKSNLELIDQALKRLSRIHESYERSSQPVRLTENGGADTDQTENNKERRAIYLLRRGENPRAISRKLGISRSELDLLMASERLGNGHKANIKSA